MKYLTIGCMLHLSLTACVPPQPTPAEPRPAAAAASSDGATSDPLYATGEEDVYGGGPYDSADVDDVSASPTNEEPASVRISITGALIGPSKADGREWDGPGARIASETAAKLAGALAGRTPYTAAAGVVAELAQSAFDKPDPYGRAELYAPDQAGRIDLPMTYRDTFTPSWSGADFVHVPLGGNVRIRVTLTDKDLVHDDSIGTIELTSADLLDALRAGNIYPVRVAEQSQNQVLFVNVSVVGE